MRAGSQRLQQNPVAVDHRRKPIARLKAERCEQRAQTEGEATGLALHPISEQVGDSLAVDRNLKGDGGGDRCIVGDIAANLVHLLGQGVAWGHVQELWSERDIRKYREEYVPACGDLAESIRHTGECPREIPDLSLLIEIAKATIGIECRVCFWWLHLEPVGPRAGQLVVGFPEHGPAWFDNLKFDPVVAAVGQGGPDAANT